MATPADTTPTPVSPWLHDEGRWSTIAVPGEQELREYLAHVLYQVRLRNAVAAGWIRVVTCGLSLTVFLSAWAGGVELFAQAPGRVAAISALHLAIACGLLVYLTHRPSRSPILAAAIVDLVLVSMAAVLAFRPSGHAAQNVLLYAATVQLLLLIDGLTVEPRALAGLAASSWVLVAMFAGYRGLPVYEAAVGLLVLGAFGATIVLAGSQLLSLAARLASQEWAARAAERHAMELQAANAALQTARVEERESSSLIVHDLRNPLVSIWANLEEVREALPASHDAGRRAVDEAIAELRRVNDMLGELLVITRLENRWSRDPSMVYVDEVLVDVERALGPLVRKAGARIEWRRASDASPTVKADPALVRRMLENLVANAVRHVRPGDRIEVAAEADGDRLRLVVRNSGPPLPAEVREHLFEKHGPSGWNGGHNVGLGLYMCRLVAERHGGSIALVERQGWNVSFEATLPTGS